jgi:galactokinase
LQDLHRDRIYNIFREKFGSETRPVIVRSPGRINLIGEHTDYNEGFVLPAAIDKTIIFAVSHGSDKCIHLVSADLKDECLVEQDNLKRSSKQWPNYLLGVIDQLHKAGLSRDGVNVVFGGDVPIGAGLSSSAALEGGFIFALNELFDLGIDKLDMVKMAQKAEHEFAGVNCGIMDQFINIFGKEKTVLKIDCRSLEYQHFPFQHDDLRIILCETPTRHDLASSEYNIRRSQCDAGVALLKRYDDTIKSLRDVSMEFLMRRQKDFDPLVFKRCRYILEENERVLMSCEDLKHNDMISFGKRMYDAHKGQRDDYEISCNDLDVLVELASDTTGVIGARMMGGGFGGCTINIVEESKSEYFIDRIPNLFTERTNKKKIKIHSAKITGGTERIE